MTGETTNCINENLADINSQYDFYKVISVTADGEMVVTNTQMCTLITELKLHTIELNKLNCLLTNAIVRVTKRRTPVNCKGCK